MRWLMVGEMLLPKLARASAETFARAGILVVQDRCLMVELRRIGR
jgi:predicted CoA-binding protein